MLKTTERIVSLTDLQRNASTIIENSQMQPVIVTQRGRPVVYVVGVEMFDELLDRLQTLEEREFKLSMALADKQFADGETVTLEEIETEFGIVGE